MSELAVPEQQHSPAVPAAQQPSPFQVQSSIAHWASEADIAYQLASKLAGTSFVPASMKGRTGDITACLLAGNELGLRPMAALKSMDVIQGTPALRAHAMRGLVQSRGHEIELVKSTPDMCVMRGRRKGAEAWQEVVWNLQRAAQMGLTKKDQWTKQPQTMLIARATGEICRLIASDVLHAVPYTSEEMRDTEPRWTAVQVGAPASAAEILARRSAPAQMPQHEEQAPEADEHAQAVAAFYAAVEASGRDRGEVLQEFWEAHGSGPEEVATEAVRAATTALGSAAS